MFGTVSFLLKLSAEIENTDIYIYQHQIANTFNLLCMSDGVRIFVNETYVIKLLLSMHISIKILIELGFQWPEWHK